MYNFSDIMIVLFIIGSKFYTGKKSRVRLNLKFLN